MTQPLIRPSPAPSRRHFLGRLTGLALGAFPALAGCRQRAIRGAPIPSIGFQGPDSLKTHAAARGFLYGCAVDVALLIGDQAYARLIAEQSNIVVAENAMKWLSLRPGPDQFNFDQADALLAFAEEHRIKVRGHNLCWHRALPQWFASHATTVNARGLLTEHIQRVVGRYAGRMHSWDVVNEAIQVTDGRPDGLRESPWLKLVGEEYIELAFKTARNADPQALVTYNDFGIEAETPDARAKRAAVLTLLRRLKARHVPVDAVGIQSHLAAGEVCGESLREFIAAARELGLQVFVTELDVNDRDLPSGLDTRDQVIAETYGRYLDLTLKDPATRAILTWGISDRDTWLNHEGARADHLPERCLPFAADDLPKAAFFAMRDAFDRRRV